MIAKCRPKREVVVLDFLLIQILYVFLESLLAARRSFTVCLSFHQTDHLNHAPQFPSSISTHVSHSFGYKLSTRIVSHAVGTIVAVNVNVSTCMSNYHLEFRYTECTLHAMIQRQLGVGSMLRRKWTTCVNYRKRYQKRLIFGQSVILLASGSRDLKTEHLSN